MKRFFILLLALVCICSYGAYAHDSSKSGTQPVIPIGEFTIISFARDNSFILSNNLIYQPTNKRYVRITQGTPRTPAWAIGDTIRVLHSDDEHRFILIDLDAGSSIKARILDEVSSR